MSTIKHALKGNTVTIQVWPLFRGGISYTLEYIACGYYSKVSIALLVYNLAGVFSCFNNFMIYSKLNSTHQLNNSCKIHTLGSHCPVVGRM